MKAIFLLIIFTVGLSASQTKKIFCYYGSWATYRNGNGKVSIEDINPNLCSHLIYTFVGLNLDGTVKVLDPWNDVTNRGFERFVALKKVNPKLKVMAAIGGWNEGSEKYSKVTNSPSLRAKLVQSILSFVLQYKFDGFDLDWEYPGQRGGASSDRDAFVKLIKELRPQFDKYNLILTAAVGASKHLIGTSYDVPNLSKYLDYINLMTYDFHGSYDGVTGQCSPLYASSKDTDKNLNVHSAIKNWIEAGADPRKIILGVALYGRSFTLANRNNNGLGAPVVSAGNAGPYSKESGMLLYLEICEKQKSGGWTTVWDNEQKNPYTYSGDQWVGYDNVKSVQLKAQYAIDNNLGGVMVWSVESDDWKNSCGGGKYTLLSALKKVIKSNDSDPTEDPITTTSTSSKPNTTTKTTSKPNEKICTKSGYVRDPYDCSIFYYCYREGDDANAIKFNCPNGLFFDEYRNVCNFPHLVEC